MRYESPMFIVLMLPAADGRGGAGSRGEMPPAEKTFTPQPDSAREARRFVLEATGDKDTPPDPRLAALVSELATNAILHARTPFKVAVHKSASHTRVAVSDQSSVNPVRRAYGPSQATGRGLVIVESLADRWGVGSDGTGKVVWFEIDHETDVSGDGG